MLKALLLAAMLLVGATAYAEDPVTSPGRVQPPPTPVTVVSQPTPPSDPWAAARAWLQAVGIPATIGIATYLMRLHTKIMEQAAMNGQVTTSGYGYGALLAQHVLANGGSAKDLGITNPDIARYADLLLQNYPEFAQKLGLTREKAAGLIAKGAAQAAAPATAPPVVIAPTEKSVAQLAYEANGGLNWASEPTAMKDHWGSIATAAPSSPVVSSIGLPIHSHGA